MLLGWFGSKTLTCHYTSLFALFMMLFQYMQLENCLQEQNKLIFRALQTPSSSISNSKCQMRPRAWRESFRRQWSLTLASYLWKLKPPEVTGGTCDLEDFLRHHPRLQCLQFAHSKVSHVVLDQEALETVGKEVEMDRCWVAHWVVPENTGPGYEVCSVTMRFPTLHSGLAPKMGPI